MIKNVSDSTSEATEELVKQLYRQLLGREAESQDVINEKIRAHKTKASLIEEFIHCDEFKTLIQHQIETYQAPLATSASCSHSLIEFTAPRSISIRERIEMTCACHDTLALSKVKDAGKVLLLEDGRHAQLMHNGLKIIAGGYCGTWMTEIIERCQGHHEPQEELIFHEVLKNIPKKATMLEIGGYWVYYSLWFLKEYPDLRKSFAIEPDPKHIQVGLINAELNQLSVDFIQGFIGKKHREISAFTTEESGVIRMPSISVEGLMKEKNINHIDLILCDAQGGEMEMLESLGTLVENNKIDFLIVSTHDMAITGDPLTHQRCLKIIQDLGGQILVEHDVHESFSGDGVIAVKFGAPIADWKEPKLSRNRYSTSLFRNPLYDLALLKRATT